MPLITRMLLFLKLLSSPVLWRNLVLSDEPPRTALGNLRVTQV